MNWKKVGSILFITATFALILILAFSNNELSNAWETLFMLDPKWILGALLGLIAYLGFDSLSLHCFLRMEGYSIPASSTLFISTIGFYYSNITPSASGGQPMQVYYMNKRGVPVGIGTSAVSIKLICMQFMVIVMGLVLWLFAFGTMTADLYKVRWIIIIGGLINFAVVPIVLLAAFYRPPVQALVHLCVRVGTKLRFIKDPEATLARVNTTLNTYHTSITHVSKNPRQVLTQLLLMGLSMLGLMTVPVSVYFAFGLSGTPWPQILTISFFLFWSASYTPLPGASGAQEGGFLLLFSGVFTSGTIGLALLIWRFFSYYSFLLIGALLTLASKIRFPKRKAL